MKIFGTETHAVGSRSSSILQAHAQQQVVSVKQLHLCGTLQNFSLSQDVSTAATYASEDNKRDELLTFQMTSVAYTSK